MIQIRFAEYSDIKSLKQIWDLCFKDDEAYIDFFYDNKFNPSQNVLLLEDNVIAAMLTMLPLSLSLPNCDALDSRMLYAIATHPGYQGRGLASKLINYCNDLLKEEKVNMSVLVPANKNLFSFYYKLGYIDGFYIRESILSSAQIKDFKNMTNACSIEPIDANDYNMLRNIILKDRVNIEYFEEDIAYQKELSKTVNADIYKIKFDETVGCAVIERLSEDKIFIKEILLPDIYLHTALKYISGIFPAEQYMVRIPPDKGANIGGNVRAFALYKPLYNTNVFKEDKTAYLGLAFD